MKPARFIDDILEDLDALAGSVAFKQLRGFIVNFLAVVSWMTRGVEIAMCHLGMTMYVNTLGSLE